MAMFYKRNASILRGRDACQGEACLVAAAGWVAAMGARTSRSRTPPGSAWNIISPVTCDPVGSLVQIPCIERNAMGALTGINAAHLAMHGDGTHKVSLGPVISTRRQTGADMSTRHKATSQGGSGGAAPVRLPALPAERARAAGSYLRVLAARVAGFVRLVRQRQEGHRGAVSWPIGVRWHAAPLSRAPVRPSRRAAVRTGAPCPAPRGGPPRPGWASPPGGSSPRRGSPPGC
jgi:hypothetical protein